MSLCAPDRRSEVSLISDAVDSLEGGFPGLVFEKRVDITDEKQVIAVFQYMRDALGRCDILINNAGSIARILRIGRECDLQILLRTAWALQKGRANAQR